jgi:hypothetical protein
MDQLVVGWLNVLVLRSPFRHLARRGSLGKCFMAFAVIELEITEFRL